MVPPMFPKIHESQDVFQNTDGLLLSRGVKVFSLDVTKPFNSQTLNFQIADVSIYFNDKFQP